MNIYSYLSRRSSLASRAFFAWMMLSSLVLHTAMLVPVTAHADVTVKVGHSDGTVSQHVLASSDEDVDVSYDMDGTDDADTPNLAALTDILGTLNSSLAEAKASVSADCDGDESSVSATTNGTVHVNGKSAQATAYAHASVKCVKSSGGEDSHDGDSHDDDSSNGGDHDDDGDNPDGDHHDGDCSHDGDYHDEDCSHDGDHDDGDHHDDSDCEDHDDGDHHDDDGDCSHDGDHDDGDDHDGGSCPATNERPVITVLDLNPVSVTLGSVYVDAGATVADKEDGDITSELVVTGTVNMSVLGTYTITYNATDSKGLSAITKTRTVNVIPPVTTCSAPIDVVTVIDRSSSMSGSPITQAKAAVVSFIDTLDPSADHVGIVSFSKDATLNMSLTNDFAAAKASLTFSTSIYTNIASGITLASNELDLHARPTARHTIILLSDGNPNYPTNAATAIAAAKAAADAAKAKGYIVYTIGLGTNVSPLLMKSLATSDANYFFAPSASDLEGIYRTISAAECQPTLSTVSGHKWNDKNGDGIRSENEEGLSGWTITMSQVAEGVTGIRTVMTDVSGAYSFNNVSPATYRVCEVNQSGWDQIAPVDGCHILTVQSGMNYVNKDFLNKQHETPSVCSVDIVSDTTNMFDGNRSAVATYAENPAWTASVPGATWIWSTLFVTDPAVDQTNVFTKNFTLAEPVASAVLTIAADNNFHASVNGTEVGSDETGLNYADANKHVYDVAAHLESGDNALSFTVKNIGLPGSTAQSNPAGLLYKLHIVYNKVGCVPPPVNQRPVITVIAPNPMTVHINSVFTDPGATALDPEDGDITANIATTSTVNTAAVGNYVVKYSVVDSKGLAAEEKTREVKVISACSDGLDNDGDSKADMADTGCENPNDDNENTPPTIALLGVTPMEITVGTTFVDPGANATDAEDCIGLTAEACNVKLQLKATGVVNAAQVGEYTITYTAKDSTGAEATPVTRTVKVVSGPVSTNQPPVITLIAPNPMTVHIGATFVDPGATALDPEDGDITVNIATTSTVNTASVGNYVVTYNVSDSKGLAAQEKIREVKVISACSDGLDNDGDGTIDMLDAGCEDPNDDTENARPVITLIGETVMQLLVGTAFTDPGANATDAEDCIGLTAEACNVKLQLKATGTVNNLAVGTYTITYNATDTQGLTAIPKTRTVNVYQNTIPGCTANCGGETNTRPVITVVGANPLSVTRGTTFTDPGATAWDQEDGDITVNIVKGGSVDTSRVGTYTLTYDVNDSKGLPALQKTRTVNVVEGTIPGCTANCGGGSVTLTIFNEKLTVTGTTTVTVTWSTNIAADSRVVYGLLPVPSLGAAPYYGYSLTTATDTTMTTAHTMVITGIPSALATYFRPVSSNGSQTVTGIELKRTPEVVTGGSCEYLKEYLRMGKENTPAEVLKLQLFLKNFEGFTTIPTDSFFGIETDKAVRAFQDKYKADVLIPWNLPGNTGYVYYTTKKKINEIYCQREFPLNTIQLDEIATFRDLINRLGAPTGVTAQTVLPLVGTNTVKSTNPIAVVAPEGAVAGAATVKPTDTVVASAEKTSSTSSPSDGRGRVALADLLAISPSLSKELGATKTDAKITSGTQGLATGDTLTKQNFFQAAVGSISNVSHLSEVMVLFVILLIIGLLAVTAFYARRCAKSRAAANEMEV